MLNRVGILVVLVVTQAIASSARAQVCGEWTALNGPGGNGVNASVSALEVFDDGTGAALYAGGFFTTAGGEIANRVARWDGTNWFPLNGPNGNGMDNTVWVLSVIDIGTGPALYAGGRFEHAGGVEANRVAKWDGSVWSPLFGRQGNGVYGVTSVTVYDLTQFDDGTGPTLVAGGEFTTAGGVAARYIAKWNGGEWFPLSGPSGNGTNNTVYALGVFDDGSVPGLYAGGNYGTAGGQTARSIARWDGSAWATLSDPGGNGVSSMVFALTVFDDGTGPALYVGGGFAVAGGVTANRVAKWDGSAWSALSGPGGTGVDSQAGQPREIRAMTVFDDGTGPALYVGGLFTTAGGVAASNIARWDGSSWSSLNTPGGGNGVSGTVLALTIFDDGDGPALYAGGAFTTAGGTTVNRISRWNPRPPCPADFNSDCVLDFTDGQAFTEAFLKGDPQADLAEPFGVLDLEDVGAFMSSFQSGCQ